MEMHRFPIFKIDRSSQNITLLVRYFAIVRPVWSRKAQLFSNTRFWVIQEIKYAFENSVSPETDVADTTRTTLQASVTENTENTIFYTINFVA